MYGPAWITSRVVSIVRRLYVPGLTTRKASCNEATIEFSQELVGELQNHLKDVVDLTHVHLKEGNHDGSANLRSNAVVTMLSLLELHRTLARSKVASAAVRKHSRGRCGELLSEITLTTQKVAVDHGKYLSTFIVVNTDELFCVISLTLPQYDTGDETNTPDITDIVSPLTVTSLLSIGGFAGTFMPVPSRTTHKDYSNPPEELIDRLIDNPSEGAVEVNFNLASKMLWSSFVINTLRTTDNQSRIYVLPDEEPPGHSPSISAGSSDTPTP